MSQEQIAQIVLDAYDANPEFKEYFDFFLEPDAEKLLEKHEKVIMKELSKIKWGYSKARTTVLKKAVKKFMGFNPGEEAILDMLFMTLNRLGITERYVNFKAPLMKYVVFITKQIIQYAELHQAVAETMARLQSEIDTTMYTVYFKRHITEGIQSQR